MLERLQNKDLQFDPMRMAIIESGAMNAFMRGDYVEFSKYVSEGLMVQFHLGKDSSDMAADYLTAYIEKGDENNLLKYHEILSKDFGFDPNLATRIYLDIEKDGALSKTSEVSRYHSMLYGGRVTGAKFWPIIETKKKVFQKYFSVKDNPKATVKEHLLAWGDLMEGLLEFYTGLNNVLVNGASERVSQ